MTLGACKSVRFQPVNPRFIIFCYPIVLNIIMRRHLLYCPCKHFMLAGVTTQARVSKDIEGSFDQVKAMPSR